MAKRAKARARKPRNGNGGAPNKSAAIRAYLATNRKAKPKDVVAALAEQGITVSPQMVSTIKSKTKGRRGRPKRTRVAQVRENERGNGFVALDAALNFVEACGGIGQAKQLIDKLATVVK